MNIRVPQQTNIKVIKILSLIFGISLSFFFIRLGYKLKTNYETILTWPSTQAVVTEHDVFEQRSSQGSKMKIPKPFNPQWTYKYKLGEQEYTSNSMSFPGATHLTFQHNRQAALKMLNKYLIGQSITIFYNPSAVQETIIDKWPRNIEKEFFLYVLGITVFFISIFVPFFLTKKQN